MDELDWQQTHELNLWVLEEERSKYNRQKIRVMEYAGGALSVHCRLHKAKNRYKTG
jgi:hypothetical protein